MFLKAGNALRNDLLEQGFDLQYIARNEFPFDDETANTHMAERHVMLPIQWPWNTEGSCFGQGAVDIKIIQTKVLKPEDVPIEGVVTIIGPNDRLLGIHLFECTIELATIACLRITYGTCFDDARYDEYNLGEKQPERLS